MQVKYAGSIYLLNLSVRLYFMGIKNYWLYSCATAIDVVYINMLHNNTNVDKKFQTYILNRRRENHASNRQTDGRIFRIIEQFRNYKALILSHREYENSARSRILSNKV